MLQKEIKEKMVLALKAREELRLSVLRGIISSITNELVAKGKKPQGELDDEAVRTVINRLAKQRKEAAEQFARGNRPELAEKEQAELLILQEFLPIQMSEDAIRQIALAKKAELGVNDATKKGTLMGAVMTELKGRADGTIVLKVVDSLL